jgi:hypothetical protein
MDQYLLFRLAEQGIGAFPATHLPELADWCFGYAEEAGDVRYCSLARTLEIISASFGRRGGMSLETVQELDHKLWELLPAIVSVSSREVGARLARRLREAVVMCLSEA